MGYYSFKTNIVSALLVHVPLFPSKITINLFTKQTLTYSDYKDCSALGQTTLFTSIASKIAKDLYIADS